MGGREVGGRGLGGLGLGPRDCWGLGLGSRRPPMGGASVPGARRAPSWLGARPWRSVPATRRERSSARRSDSRAVGGEVGVGVRGGAGW